MTTIRTTIRDFMLANPVYIGASVSFYSVDESGASTGVLATLYSAPTGLQTVANPQTLDGDGKFLAPVYIEAPVIAEVVASGTGSHSTGVIGTRGTWRGDWVTDTLYFATDFIVDGATDKLYVATQDFTSGASLAADVAAGNLEFEFDVPDAAAQAAAAAASASNAATSASNASGSAGSASDSADAAAASAALAATATPALYTNTLATLAQVDPNFFPHVYVDDTTAAGVAGPFSWDGSDLSGSVDGADVVAPGAGNSAGLATDGTEGAWIRKFDKLDDGSVVAAKIASNAVTTSKILDANVTTSKILDANVTTSKILDANVTEAKLAAAFLARLGLDNEIYAEEYEAVGDDTADDATPLTNWINAWKAASPEKDAILSSKTYRITTQLPNLLNPDSRLLGKGRPIIHWDGGTVTDLIQISDPSQARYTQHIKNLTLDGNASAQGLLLLDRLNHAVLEDIYLRNCHPGYQAMKTLACVLGKFRNIICSANNGGAFSSIPYNGLILGSGTTGADQTIACIFENTIFEGITSTGLSLVNSWYNTFIGGTSEGNGSGVYVAEYSRSNTLINFFCEANTEYDYQVDGDANQLINCEGASSSSSPALTINGDFNIITGGRYQDVTVGYGATGNILDNVTILGTYTDNGTSTVKRN